MNADQKKLHYSAVIDEMRIARQPVPIPDDYYRAALLDKAIECERLEDALHAEIKAHDEYRRTKRDQLETRNRALLAQAKHIEQLRRKNVSHAGAILQSAVQDVNRLTAERDLLAKTNRTLIDMVRDDAKRIRDLERRIPCASGRQLWQADDFGRHNLTQGDVSQRTEARLGVAPWLAYLCRGA